ncbi:MAG: hypothetical protein IKW98_07280 [Prevotella sp.]|nr:hypothetical protein [Prevotella sp.]
MESIGGYFSLELPRHEEYHRDAISLNTGRNCLEYILRVRKYSKVYIPYYTCKVVLEPFTKLNIAYEFYHINFDFELTDEIVLGDNEALLYTNYFGLKRNYVEQLASKYGLQLIIDNTQAFFAKPIPGIDTFYTCRKFFGVPDGAYLYIDLQLDMEMEQDSSFERMHFLTKRIDLSPEAGYRDYQALSRTLVGQPIRRMSKLTQRMMQGIEYESIIQKRKTNYHMLDVALGNDNCIKLPIEYDAVPMVYPYLSLVKGLREKLIDNKVFVPCYWPNVMELCQSNSREYKLAENLVCLPIDQRYGESHMMHIISCISEIKKELNENSI